VVIHVVEFTSEQNTQMLSTHRLLGSRWL